VAHQKTEIMIAEQESSKFKQNLVRRCGSGHTAPEARTAARSSEAQDFLAMCQHRAAIRPTILQSPRRGKGIGVGA
jgi:hypothetical protein